MGPIRKKIRTQVPSMQLKANVDILLFSVLLQAGGAGFRKLDDRMGGENLVKEWVYSAVRWSEQEKVGVHENNISWRFYDREGCQQMRAWWKFMSTTKSTVTVVYRTDARYTLMSSKMKENEGRDKRGYKMRQA